ncbi:hypothetical protein SteCoe_24971 [Stentor coeruleus]|uniref:Uncharacterized protein n=1 Tax=Stentor coeruleus TaxID=5963 RepID=A0A1R2BGA0_9CILI|nr:hypothetical protein SteCoe_24971 [Stentor coeruleus]
MSASVEEHINAPDYCTINAGISFFSKCKSVNCPAFKKNIVINSGYVTGDLGRLSQSLCCPVCKTTASEFFKIGIACSEVLIEGKDINGEKIKIFKSVSNFEDIDFKLENCKFVMLETWAYTNPPKYTILWINSLGYDKHIKLAGDVSEITLFDYAENFENMLRVPKASQVYYFGGIQIYKLNPKLTSINKYLSVVNIESRMPKSLAFLIDNQSEFKITTSAKKLYDAIFEMTESYNIQNFFISNISIKNSNNQRYTFDTLLSIIPDNEIIYLSTINLSDKFNLTVDFKDLSINFDFDPNTPISELKYILSLKYKIHENYLSISSTFTEIDEEGTLLSNNPDMIIINDLRRGGNIALPNLNDDEKIIYIKHNDGAPNYRVVREGLNWKSYCRNRECAAQGQIVISNSGYGIKEYSKNITDVMCPACSKKVNPESLGFYKCRQMFLGTTLSRKVERGNLVIYENDEFNYFKEHKKHEWLRFKIQVDKL